MTTRPTLRSAFSLVLKRSENEEIVSGNGHEYKFTGTLGGAETLSLIGNDVMLVLAGLQSGLLNVTDIKNCIKCFITHRDGSKVDENDLDDIVVEFIEDFGLQECSVLARMLITYAVIGNLKKKQIANQETTTTIIEKLSLSRSTISRKLGWLLGGGLAISATLVCAILYVSNLPIS